MGQRTQAVARIFLIPIADVASLIAGTLAFALIVPIFVIDIFLQLFLGKEGFTANNPAMAFMSTSSVCLSTSPSAKAAPATPLRSGRESELDRYERDE